MLCVFLGPVALLGKLSGNLRPVKIRLDARTSFCNVMSWKPNMPGLHTGQVWPVAVTSFKPNTAGDEKCTPVVSEVIFVHTCSFRLCGICKLFSSRLELELALFTYALSMC